MNLPKQHLSEPFNPYSSGPHQRITYRDRDHTPWNKRPGSCESLALAEIDRHGGTGAVTIHLSEITTHRSGKVTSRAIAISVDAETAKKIAAFIGKEVA